MGGGITKGTSKVALVVKNLLANVGDIRDTGSIPGLGRSSEGGHGNPLQYSCLENPMDRGEPGGLQSMGCKKYDLACTHGSTNIKFTAQTFFELFIFNWRIIVLQYCVGFCHTST